MMLEFLRHYQISVPIALLALLASSPNRAQPVDTSALSAAIQGQHRSEMERARDRYRHPLETLEFMGISADMTVVELWPGKGWYTQILAPYLRERGELRAASFGDQAKPDYRARFHGEFLELLAAGPEIHDRVRVTTLNPPAQLDLGPAGSADAVLTFRNLHNWIKDGVFEQVLRASFEVLKPGGLLGVVEHRARPDASSATDPNSGYVLQQSAIAQIEAAGFRFVESSEINANASDSTEHPKGVWTLPPSLRLKDVDRDRYLAIGESDRMTLKFIKP